MPVEGGEIDLRVHPSGIVPQLQNVVATVDLGCKLDLKEIALQARNAEYNPKVRHWSQAAAAPSSMRQPAAALGTCERSTPCHSVPCCHPSQSHGCHAAGQCEQQS